LVAKNPLMFGKEHRHVHFLDMRAVPRLYSIHNMTRRVLVGTAMVVFAPKEPKYCILHDIWVRDDMRREGYGRDLMHSIQNDFEKIETQWRSKEGWELCLNCGFKLHKAMFKNQVDKLIWEKGDKEE
jgi:GNAT superfamily N-acetyltransferase